MRRGDLTNMSFAFSLWEGGDDWVIDDEEMPLRIVRPNGVEELFDVSVVTYPAYRETFASMRTRQGVAAERRSAPAARIVEPSRMGNSVRLSAFRRDAKLRILRDRVSMSPTPLPEVAQLTPA